MSWDTFGMAFLAGFLAVFFGVALFEWLRAEVEERKWRRVIEKELAADAEWWEDPELWSDGE